MKELVRAMGYALKNVRDAQVGDTVTNAARPRTAPVFYTAKSLVFAGVYPLSGEDYPLLRDALEKLPPQRRQLHVRARSDRARVGFRCGFLGLLAVEIVQERLEGIQPRPHPVGPVASTASIRTSRGVLQVDNPPSSAGRGDRGDPRTVGAPERRRTDAVHRLAHGAIDRRGAFDSMEYLDPQRVSSCRFEIRWPS